MINIAICEDNDDERALLKKTIERVMDEKKFSNQIGRYNIYTYQCAEEMLMTLEDIKYHLVFLDIYMNQMTGIELAKKIRITDTQTIIIFATASKEFAVEGYTVRAYHYLIKPFKEGQLEEVISSAFNHLTEKNNRYFLFSTPNGVIKENLNNIYYIECVGRKTSIVTKSYSFESTYSINNLEEKLDPLGFIRSHRSFIVNLRYIKGLKLRSLILENGDEIFLSKYRQKEVKNRLTRYLGGQI